MAGFRILLITTGGTIAQKHDAQNRAVAAGEGSNPFEDLLGVIKERVNEATKITNENYTIDAIETIELKDKEGRVLNKDSSNIIPEDWVGIIDEVYNNYDKYDAFVITHGTNTLGYTSAALSFALGKLGKPVVLTGSQVSFGFPGSDAQMNLENAIRIASYSKEKLIGVMVVFGSMIITGTRVKKTTEFDYDAFKSFNSGTIGRIGNSVRIDRDALERHKSFLGNPAKIVGEIELKKKFDTRIASFTEYPGMDASIFEALVKEKGERKEDDNSIRGIIFRATGAGDPNVGPEGATFKNLRDGFEFLRKNEVPIVVTTQAPDGIASMDVNNPGVLAYQLGAIPAKDMSMESMTVKLAWLLGRKLPYEEMREMMTTPFRGEIRP